jgi:hypothetical protein
MHLKVVFTLTSAIDSLWNPDCRNRFPCETRIAPLSSAFSQFSLHLYRRLLRSQFTVPVKHPQVIKTNCQYFVGLCDENVPIVAGASTHLSGVQCSWFRNQISIVRRKSTSLWVRADQASPCSCSARLEGRPNNWRKATIPSLHHHSFAAEEAGSHQICLRYQ